MGGNRKRYAASPSDAHPNPGVMLRNESSRKHGQVRYDEPLQAAGRAVTPRENRPGR